MYYELYIDVLFLINFMMDSLLLLAVKKILKCQVRNIQVFWGGAAGAVLTCIFIVLPLPTVVKFPIFYGGINSIMLLIGLRIKRRELFWKAFALLFVAAFLMGGMMQVLRPWIRTGSLFFAAAIPIYYLLCGIWRFLLHLRRHRERFCEVVLHMGMEKYRVNALVDSGNVLTDPVSGEPVSVIDPGCARKILEDQVKNRGVRYIPYRTVSGEGVMPVFRAEQMEVILPEGKEGVRMSRPVIGIGEGQISEQEDYQMILNPDIFV